MRRPRRPSTFRSIRQRRSCSAEERRRRRSRPIGDFVQYALTIQNTATNAAVPNATMIDQLPAGMRYRAGSTRIDGERASDPTISADGQTLTFSTGALGPNRRREIRYVAEITAGASGKQLVNQAYAQGPDGVASNAAQATIELREELFRERAFLMGRVVEGSCDVAAEKLRRCRRRARVSRGRPLLGDRPGRQVSLRRCDAGLARRADRHRDDSGFAPRGRMRRSRAQRRPRLFAVRRRARRSAVAQRLRPRSSAPHRPATHA